MGNNTSAGNTKLCVGSNSGVVKFIRDDHSGCVIHLIDPIDTENNDEDLDVSAYITDQIPDLWHSLRHGDLIEDVSGSGKIFAVKKKKQTDAEYIFGNGFEIVELEKWNDTLVIPHHFYAITRFSPGYHDHSSMVTNNTYAPHYSVSLIEWDSYLVPIDLKKLKLNDLNHTDDVIFEQNIQIGRNRYTLSYVVLTFRGVNYMIALKGESSSLKLQIRSEYLDAKWGIEAVESLGMKTKILNLLAKEEVLIHNFLLI